MNSLAPAASAGSESPVGGSGMRYLEQTGGGSSSKVGEGKKGGGWDGASAPNANNRDGKARAAPEQNQGGRQLGATPPAPVDGKEIETRERARERII